MINTNDLSDKELASVEKLELKLFQGEVSEAVALKYFSILGEYLLAVSPSQYAKSKGVSYNTARSRSIEINGNRFCFISEPKEQPQ